jgi:ribosomal protein L31E
MSISTIRLRGVFARIRSTKKKQRAADHIRRHVAKFNNINPDFVMIDPKLNSYMMRYNSKSGDALKVDIVKSGEKITLKLAEEVKQKPEEAKKGAKAEVKADSNPVEEKGSVAKNLTVKSEKQDKGHLNQQEKQKDTPKGPGK